MSSPVYDLCVIGAGSGGLSAAAGAAAFGQKVVLIEKERMGGDCLNTGCVPSKALIAAARAAYGFSESGQFGVKAQDPQVDFRKVQAHVQAVIAAIAPHDSVERFEDLGVRVIRAAARFASPGEVTAGTETIRARRFVIATGSSPAAPAIPGLDTVPYLTNETIFENRTLPEKLLIIGGGPIGMEMAQAHARLGSKVTVLEAFTPLGKDDSELTAVVLEQLQSEGIEILAGTDITGIKRTGKNITVDISTDEKSCTLTGSHLLVAAGRRANVDGLGLEVAGIEYSARGIKVDRGLKTTNRRVYAIGDVAGGMQFTHVAGYHAGLVVKNALFHLPVRNRTEHIPWVTYTDPELAHVGLNEEMARQKGLDFKVLRWPFSENDRARCERKTAGLVKVIVSNKGHIWGATIVGAHAGELIAPWCLAIASGLKIRAMMDQVIAYPTLAEAGRRAAVGYYADFPQKPFVRKLIDWLKILG